MVGLIVAIVVLFNYDVICSEIQHPLRTEKGDHSIFNASSNYKPANAPGPGPNGLALTPPMGWMSWERFRCQTDCKNHPTECINEKLYMQMADHLASDGFLDAGYKSVSIDDCWENQNPPRDAQGKLSPDPSRFPSGFKALGDYMHSRGVSFGIYSDEGTHTCAGRPGSKGHEMIDAQTFAEWGVDYLKLDGCNNDKSGYASGYPAMGTALQKSGRNITYSCSWPAYLGSNETAKPWNDMIQAGCNLWRNWHDINNHWESLVSIIDHWGDYGPSLQAAAGPGHWNDPDMLLVGDDHYDSLLSIDQAQTQMSIWAIMASPLIMAADLRSIKSEYKAILINKDVIAIDQDKLGKSGLRITPKGDQEVWAREVHDGIAVVLLNKIGVDDCEWNVTEGKYLEGGNIWCGTWDKGVAEARSQCCGNPKCKSFSFSNDGSQGGCLKNSIEGYVINPKYDGWARAGGGGGGSIYMSFKFSDVGFSDKKAKVRDLWAQKDLGVFTNSFGTNVTSMGVRMIKLSSTGSK